MNPAQGVRQDEIHVHTVVTVFFGIRHKTELVAELKQLTFKLHRDKLKA